jgi:nucleoside-diphosphate-sugar epimerase
MRIIVTGSQGYLGQLLVPTLIEAGHEVLGIDTGYFRNGWLYRDGSPSPRALEMDIREMKQDHFDGTEAVVHLAELSNDPMGDLLGKVTYEVNYRGSVWLAKLARAAGVERFVYMSSCSVYGVAEGEIDETAPVNPQTVYAECKSLVERDVAALAGDGFSPTFLRSATAFGASPRMRFDIVLNNLAGLAWTTGTIAMTSDGTPWRPLIHGLDIAKAIRCVLAADRDKVHSEVFNVGSNDQNYQVRDIAETVARVFVGCQLSFGQPSPDNRSYKVNFDKIHDFLPGFGCEWSAQRGAEQLRGLFERVQLDKEAFEGRGYTRLKQLEYLLRTAQVDDHLFWAN